MHDYSFAAVVVMICAALFTDRLKDRRTDTRRTTMDDISTAELKALSCAKNTRNTCNPLGDFLTSSDLNIGQSDLNPCMSVDLRETNKATAETL